MEKFLKYGIQSFKKEELAAYKSIHDEWLERRRTNTPPHRLLLELMRREWFDEPKLVEAGLKIKESVQTEKNVEPFVDSYLHKKEAKNRRRPPGKEWYCPAKEHQELRLNLGISDPTNDNPWDFGRSEP
ncbi:MAG: hypothetical protein AAGG53_02415 [Cyanobacteria bacterium P01_H01_bin.152]